MSDRKSTRLNSSHSQISYAVFCLNDTPPTAIYTLSLHDALPIFRSSAPAEGNMPLKRATPPKSQSVMPSISMPSRWACSAWPSSCRRIETKKRMAAAIAMARYVRSEEHTSELQSQSNLVCRLLLERYAAHRDLHSFPTRRSSDLPQLRARRREHALEAGHAAEEPERDAVDLHALTLGLQRVAELMQEDRDEEEDGSGDRHGQVCQIGRAHV